MIGPEQGKKASGKSGKKKNKAKKAKRLAVEIDPVTSTAREDDLASPVAPASDPAEPHVALAAAPDPQPAAEQPYGVTSPDPPAPSDVVPDVGPQLLAWIDRVQERVDHLLTLVDPALESSAAEPEPEPATSEPEPAEPEPATSEPEPAEPELTTSDLATEPEPETSNPATEPTEPETAASEPEPTDPEASSLAEAWARRQQAGVIAAIDDDEPFESVDPRLTAVLVARELIARGESPADVRRRLREGYGVIDPDAVLAQIAA